MKEKILKYFDLSLGVITIFIGIFFLIIACPLFSTAYNLRDSMDYATNGTPISRQIIYYIVTGGLCAVLFISLFGTSFLNFNKIHNGKPLKNLHEIELLFIFVCLVTISVVGLICMPYDYFNVILGTFGFFGIVLTLANIYSFKNTYIGFILDILECLFIVLGVTIALATKNSYVYVVLVKSSIGAMYSIISVLIILYSLVLGGYFGIRDYHHDYFNLKEE